MVVVAGYKKVPIDNPSSENRYLTSYQENYGKSTMPARPQSSAPQITAKKA